MYKKEQEIFLNKAEAFIRKGGLSDKQIHKFLYGFHMFELFFFIFIVFFLSKKWFIGMSIFIFFIFSIFFLLDGCILTKLEHRFSDENNIIVDFLLRLTDTEITKENRIDYTKYTFGFFTLGIFGVYYFRFGRKKLEVII